MANNRQSIRLKNYDYSQTGLYFVTVCTQNRECLFGHIINHPVGVGRDRPNLGLCNHTILVGRDRPVSMILNKFGIIIKNVWESLHDHHPVELDAFQIMPNHIHFILHIVSGASRYIVSGASRYIVSGASRYIVSGASRRAPTTIITPTYTLGFIVGMFKTGCTVQINRLRNTPGQKNFQRNYYEHIIRNEHQLHKIRQYIKNNPIIWNIDINNPSKHVPITCKNP